MEKIKEIKEKIVEKYIIVVCLNEKEINEALVAYSISKLNLDNGFTGNFISIGRKECVDSSGFPVFCIRAEVKLIKRQEIV